MLKRLWRKGNYPTMLMGIQIGIATMENSVEVSQTTKRCHMIQQSHSWAFFQKKTVIQKDTLYTYVHSSTVLQGMETAEMCIDRQIDTEDVVCIYNGILLGHKKNGILLFAITWQT